MKRSLLLTLALLLFTSCATVTLHQEGYQSFPAKPDDCSIKVYNVPPKQDYVEVATITSESYGTIEDLLPRYTKRACRAGGDAIIILGSTAGMGTYAGGVVSQIQNHRAVVIKFQ